MSHLLPADCLNEIFENLEDDRITLHSCLLVNRLWCEVSVGILWRNVWSFICNKANGLHRSFLCTLAACLPKESKKLLRKNNFFIIPRKKKPPLFNYAAFCKVLSINDFCRIIKYVFRDESSNRYRFFVMEIMKMFMSQISSLKKLTYLLNDFIMEIADDVLFTIVPGARDCLVDLSELRCSTNNHSEFFYHLSQICHNLRSLTIRFEDNNVSNELKELISSQNNLKSLNLTAFRLNNWTNIIPSLTKHSNTLTKLHFYGDNDNLPLLFTSLFPNLQEIVFAFFDGRDYKDFKELQHVTFPKLQTLKFFYGCPKPEHLFKFLENNGKNLREFYPARGNDYLGLYVTKYCPNIRKLYIILEDLSLLYGIFSRCEYLEIIEIWCGGNFLNEKEVLEIVVKYSPKSFYGLTINYDSSKNSQLKLLPKDLESFFVSWKNRPSKKSLSLVGPTSFLDNRANVEIFEKYKNLGVIKKYEFRNYDGPEDEG